MIKALKNLTPEQTDYIAHVIGPGNMAVFVAGTSKQQLAECNRILKAREKAESDRKNE